MRHSYRMNSVVFQDEDDKVLCRVRVHHYSVRCVVWLPEPSLLPEIWEYCSQHPDIPESVREALLNYI